LRLAPGTARAGIGGEPLRLLCGIAEFVEAIGEFQLAPERFEACGDWAADPGERRLRCREVPHERDAVFGEAGATRRLMPRSSRPSRSPPRLSGTSSSARRSAASIASVPAVSGSTCSAASNASA